MAVLMSLPNRRIHAYIEHEHVLHTTIEFFHQIPRLNDKGWYFIGLISDNKDWQGGEWHLNLIPESVRSGKGRTKFWGTNEQGHSK